MSSVKSGAVTKAAVRPVMPTVRALSPLQRHDIVAQGVPVLDARALIASFDTVDRGLVLQAVGISERTLQRGKTPDKRLDINASDRAMRLSLIVEQATDVLGSRAEAERWLGAPAMGLDQRRPIELLQTSEGAELVRTLLVRMDHGVYA